MRPVRRDDSERRIGFRPFTAADLVAASRWLGDPDVARWYADGEPTVANLTARYADLLAGTDAATGWVITVNREDAGFIQCYRLGDEADYARQLDLPAPYGADTVGIDLYLGEPRYRNGGWGPVVLRAFLRRIVFGEWAAPSAVIGPEPANARAIRAYERAGFVWCKTVEVVDDDPDHAGHEYLMVQTVAEFVERFGPSR